MVAKRVDYNKTIIIVTFREASEALEVPGHTERNQYSLPQACKAVAAQNTQWPITCYARGIVDVSTNGELEERKKHFKGKLHSHTLLDSYKQNKTVDASDKNKELFLE